MGLWRPKSQNIPCDFVPRYVFIVNMAANVNRTFHCGC